MIPNTSSPSTTLEGPSSPFPHFPWPFLDDVDEELFMSQMLSQHQSAPVTRDAPVHVANGGNYNLPTTAREHMTSEGDSVAVKAMIPKKAKEKKMEIIPSNRRSGKKDRHSKICTAQGIRDRRMRLSLEIARKFFDLQDMLGFDKASKTIEWLLKNCKAAIQQLTHSLPQDGGEKSMSFSASEESEEVESEANKEMEIKPTCEEEKQQQQEPLVGNKACRKKRKRRNSCNDQVGAMIIGDSHDVARESRDKARARARSRTREKLIVKGLDQNSNTKSTESNPQISIHHHLHAAGHQDSGNSSPQADLFEEPEADSVAVMEELLGITRSSSSSTFSYNSNDFAAASSGANHHNNEFPGFLAIQKGVGKATIEPAPGCYTMTSKTPSLGNVQVLQNIPNAMFRTTMSAQDYDHSPPDPSSTFMTTISNGGQWNPSSNFVAAPGTLDQQNHFPNSSFIMTRKSNSLEAIVTTPMFTATRPNYNVSFQSHFMKGSQFL